MHIVSPITLHVCALLLQTPPTPVLILLANMTLNSTVAARAAALAAAAPGGLNASQAGNPAEGSPGALQGLQVRRC